MPACRHSSSSFGIAFAVNATIGMCSPVRWEKESQIDQDGDLSHSTSQKEKPLGSATPG